MTDTKRIEELESLIKEKQLEIDNFEQDPDDYIEQYHEAIDESGPVIIFGLEYQASMVFLEVDPTGYRCCLNDFVDSFDLSDDPRYQEMEEELEELEEELEELREEN